jgi:hypothetical protein
MMKTNTLCWICVVLGVLMVVAIDAAKAPKIPKPKVFNCSDAQELRTAFKKVNPGDNIFLNDGVYNSSNDNLFKVLRSGNATHPIVMNSSGNAILTSGGFYSGNGLYVSANYWIFTSKLWFYICFATFINP